MPIFSYVPTNSFKKCFPVLKASKLNPTINCCCHKTLVFPQTKKYIWHSNTTTELVPLLALLYCVINANHPYKMCIFQIQSQTSDRIVSLFSSNALEQCSTIQLQAADRISSFCLVVRFVFRIYQIQVCRVKKIK